MVEVLISAAHKAIVVPYDRDLAAFPHVHRVEWNGPKLVVPDDLDNVRFLRNIGFDVPSPILREYDWQGTTPWEVQKNTASLLTVSPRAYVLNQMRTGKTRSVLFSADYLMAKGVIDQALIVAPLSTLNIVWAREIVLGFPKRSFRVLHGEKGKRISRLEEDVDFYIINHDGLAVIGDELGSKRSIDLVVFDEVATFREQRTRRWETAAAVAKGRKYVWGLSGAPTPNAPTDAYGIAKLITPERVPRYYGQFRDATMLRVSQFRWVPKKDAVSIVAEALRPSVRFTRKDIADSPPVAFLDRECELSPRATTAMTTMIKKLRVMSDEGSITAVNAGVLLNKLMQMACGWVYADDGTVIDVTSPTRLQAIAEIVAETEYKSLVFVPFVHAVEGVTAYLKHKGYDVAMVYGDTPSGERDKIFSAFQQTDQYDVIVAHPGTMAHGLNLSAADTVIWYGCPPSNELYHQANDRVAIPGLPYSTCVVHVTGHPVERRRYSGLRKQEGAQQCLLDILHGVNVGV